MFGLLHLYFSVIINLHNQGAYLVTQDIFWLSDQESACNTGAVTDRNSIFGSGLSPVGEHRKPLQHCCLENSQGQMRVVGL